MTVHHDLNPFLQVEGLSKTYQPGNAAVPPVFEHVNFDIHQGEFVCIIGHSGCGKSTILNILAGLDDATEGYAIMNGKQVVGPSLERGVVFQSHALLPWLSALNNVEFGVRSRWPKKKPDEVTAHAMHYLDMVGLGKAAHKKPHELSGGMKQRVGIARAFAIEPQMLLLDEPFGALDALTRGTIQDELLQIVQATRQTVFMITHDVDEAILLADKVLLMSHGPRARIAEIVEITLPRNRTRASIHHDPQYYAIRNHLVDFLVNRASPSVTNHASDVQQRHQQPPVVRPGLAALKSETNPANIHILQRSAP
ncbi:ABC transporter ATP-binding protein [Limnobacter humi]|uniref:ABC transporter ATP-binding protein n=1 Tax=Limnobacter humi TaxID=1778671 RepID=A0ABT1WC30_9BURK|nr:ABC transporter ATP-binding protein [Limnobacter humi]MCQ8895068.1 ABC transporter ATP-binding protein [Limnobacter humi]